MSYLLTQMWMCLFLTALVAGVAGWLLRGGGASKLKQLEEEMKVRLKSTENERDQYASQLQKLNGVAEERADLERRLQETEQAADEAARRLQEQESTLVEKARELDESNLALSTRLEEEQQVFSQRLAEVEAGAEHAEFRIREYEETIGNLEMELTESRSRLDEATTRLAEAGNDQSRQHKENVRTTDEDAVRLVESEVQDVESLKPQVANDETVVAAPFPDPDQQQAQNDDANLKGLLGIGGLAGVAGLAKSTLDKAVDNVQHASEEFLHRSSPEDSVYSLAEIRSISRDDRLRLYEMGIETTEDLLEKCADREQVQLFAKILGKEAWVVRSWASAADLLRVNGVTGYHAELLELSGISSTEGLARANPDKLLEGMAVIHRHVGNNQPLPELADLKAWVDDSDALKPILEKHIDKV